MTTVMTWIGLASAVTFAVAVHPRPALAGSLPDMVLPHNAGVQLKNNNFSRADLEQVREAGFRIIRKGMYWSTVEPRKGEYDFSEYDRLIDDAEALGLTVLGCLYGNNRLYEDHGAVSILTEAGRQGYAAFAAAMAQRYKDRNVLWEIWNEPNVRTFWRRDGQHNSPEFAAEYTALVKAAVPAMLKVDPDAFVMAGSVSNYWQPSYEWTESCLREGILASGIRAWSVHPYGVKTPEEFVIGHQRTRELLTQYGAPADFPMINTERGFSLKEGGLDHTGGQGEGWSGGPASQAQVYQAWHFVRQYMIDMMSDVKFTVWYEWGGNEGFALHTGDKNHPAYQAAKVMFEQLDGFRYVRRLESDSPRDYVLMFEHPDGARKLVAWTAPAPGGTPDEAIDHVAAIEIGPRFELTDLAGTRNATASAIALTLTGAPQYVPLPADVQPQRVTSLAPVARPTAGPSQPPAPVAGSVDLQLFKPGVEWQFMRNTGEGSFELATQDGQAIGVMQYDFTQSTTQSTPYVLASTSLNIPAGMTEVRISARSPIAQQLTFRLVDTTGQTHQFKARIKGTGHWEVVSIPLTRRLEHWGGASDGRIHFPIKSIVLSVPQPGQTKAGKVEYTGVMAVAE